MRRSGIIGVTAAAVVASGTSAALASPVSAPDVTVIGASLQPILVGQATDPYASGSQSLVFYARHVGASSWDLLNGYTVAGTIGSAAVADLSIEDGFEYRVDHCDSTGCASTSVKTGYVSALLGIGKRPGATTLPFTIGDTVGATVDVGSGNLMVSASGGLPGTAVYNSISRFHLDDFVGSLSSGWRLSTGSDVYLKQ
jgi:hypothetical protein